MMIVVVVIVVQIKVMMIMVTKLRITVIIIIIMIMVIIILSNVILILRTFQKEEKRLYIKLCCDIAYQHYISGYWIVT